MNKNMVKSPRRLKVFMLCLAVIFLAGAAINVGSSKASASDFRTDLTKQESLKQANAMNIQICDEGFVLLKNDIVSGTTRALPYSPTNASGRRISVFGRNSTTASFVYNGGGSSAAGSLSSPVGIYEGLEMASYTLNPTLRAFYETDTADDKAGPGRVSRPDAGYLPSYRTGETPIAQYANATTPITYTNYLNMAVVVISRSGAENADAPMYSGDDPLGYANGGNNANVNTPFQSRSDLSQHYFELDDNEKALLLYVNSLDFARTVVILNTTVMEAGFINDPQYGIDAALWVGGTGRTGAESIGRVLYGTVNPSGRHVDTWYSDFTLDPTYFDFSSNSQGRLVAGIADAGDMYHTTAGPQNSYRFINYQEGIYMGYRYYETRGYEERQKVLTTNPSATEAEQFAWYDNAVTYPFGYGLSYTAFDWEIVNSVPVNNAAVTRDGSISVSVKVKNIGTVAGKDVVQLYYSAPYTKNGIEKAHVILGGFAKTKLLAANEEQILTVSLKVRDMASYDWSDKNGNSFKGYELDAGAYTIYVGKNAHDAWRSGALKVNYTVPAGGFQYRENHTGDYDIVNRFDEAGSGLVGGEMSRSDFVATMPHFTTPAERTVTQEFLNKLGNTSSVFTINEAYDAGKPWYTDKMPEQRETAVTGAEEDLIILSDLAGRDKDDPLWEDYMDQFTIAQLALMVQRGRFLTAGIPQLGVPSLLTLDGPLGFVGTNTVGLPTSITTDTATGTGSYASTVIMASTYNEELIEKVGIAMGNEGLVYGFNGVYAPGVNIHRSPFCGRNFEYYSEDGFMAGKAAAAFVRGIQSRGVIAYLKHFAFRQTEEERNKKALWATEQTLREIYLKAFELPVREGDAWGTMVSSNAIGSNWWTGNSYDLVTEVLKNEWGFRGTVITDWPDSAKNSSNGMKGMIRAGTDYILANPNNSGSRIITDDLRPTSVAALRRAARGVLHAVTLTNTMPRFNGLNEARVTSNKFSMDASSENSRFQSRSVGITTGSSDLVTYFPALNESYSLTGELPQGLKLDETKGVISGDATKAAPGKYDVTVNYVINGFIYGRNEVSIIVPGLSYSAALLANGNVGTQYVASVATAESIYAGGIAYSLKSGSLPAGLSLDSGGTIIGTPTAAGTSTFTVAASAIGLPETQATFTITIGAALVSPVIPPDYADEIKGLEDKINDLEGKIKKMEESSGCGSSSASIIALFGLLACALVVVIKKQF